MGNLLYLGDCLSEDQCEQPYLQCVVLPVYHDCINTSECGVVYRGTVVQEQGAR